jgi:isopentenyl-diphosphate delta-isomerase
MLVNPITEHVVLVDASDQPLGEMEKMEAHRRGTLHRAFSVFVFNSRGELLLQRRAAGKYHSAGLWTNTCCSHPRPGEGTHAAAERRLREEMGMDCQVEWQFSFLYRSELDAGMIEHELDHVFVAHSDTLPVPDPLEVSDWRWASPGLIRSEMQSHPDRYTAWFKICFDRALKVGIHRAA